MLWDGHEGHERRWTKALMVAATALFGVTMLSGTPGYAETRTVRYDAGEMGLLVGQDGTGQARNAEIVADTETGHQAIGAPIVAPSATSVSTVRLDPCGGRFDDGTDEGTWSLIVSTRLSFKDWNTAGDGRGMAYQPGDAVDLSQGGDVALYAQYDQEVTVASEALPNVTRDGYVLDGWFTQADGGELVGKAGEKPSDEVLLALVGQGVEVPLYAHWVTGDGTPVTIPDTSGQGFKGDLAQTGTIGVDATPVVILFVVAGIASAVFMYFSKKS